MISLLKSRWYFFWLIVFTYFIHRFDFFNFLYGYPVNLGAWIIVSLQYFKCNKTQPGKNSHREFTQRDFLGREFTVSCILSYKTPCSIIQCTIQRRVFSSFEISVSSAPWAKIKWWNKEGKKLLNWPLWQVRFTRKLPCNHLTGFFLSVVDQLFYRLFTKHRTCYPSLFNWSIL